MSFSNVNNTTGIWIGINDLDQTGTYNPDGSTPGQVMSMISVSSDISPLWTSYDIETFTGIVPPDPYDLYISFTG